MPGTTLRVRTQNVKKALCIAVRYGHLRHLGYELANVNEDVKRVQSLLVDNFGYSKENITVLTDNDDPDQLKPTRENILRAMRELVADAIPGDRLVFHLSGHGSQVVDLDGDEENDGLDEVFWPMDVELTLDDNQKLANVENYILDDEIKKILVDGLPPGANLVLFFDCCHSGTMADLPHSRSDHKGRVRQRDHFKIDGINVEGQLDASNEPPELTPDSPNSASSEGSELPETPRALPNVVCWSACKDPQETYEDPRGGGMFIKFLSSCIREDVTQTHEQLLSRTSKKLKAYIGLFNGILLQRGSARPPVAIPRPRLSTLHDYDEVVNVPIASLL